MTATVTLLPKVALDRICHDEQMVIWASAFAGALNVDGYLREDLSYADGVDLQEAIKRELRSIIGMVLDHPEARTVMRATPTPGPLK